MHVSTVDYTASNAKKLFVNSILKTGFGIIKNHNINYDLMENVFSDWKNFFSLPEHAKKKYLFKRNFTKVQDGFFPQTIAETAKGFTAKDLKEFFHYYPCSNKIPKEISKSTKELRQELLTIAKTILTWLQEELPASISKTLTCPLTTMIDDNYQTLLRILHYPAIKNQPLNGAVRAAAHEDINLITLLISPSASGLQVLDNKGTWHDVLCDKNCITVNVGDMLQECTKSYYRSTKHRVINPHNQSANKPRYSIPLFLHAKDDAVLSQQYTAKEYRCERLKELGLL